jgi:putative FmdB family regulatory protein
MPLYEYACRSCQHTFEELVFGNESVECPQCHAHKVERLLSVPARPQVSGQSPLPMGCNSQGPPCGAPWCQRQ